ncbi:LysE family translocator [Loigolactobacillus bifermentans]|uniref:Transporter LysE family protein n=1 Tax=Loigolactobacillus bifermentans DSM 20003 TaxID=1423726 RepID=A0A0R1H259_9LACO|nr:LysE family transporter [Loigolactobacillus bifermentans]KRK40678.1 transporter LysE family protein [Loigolactobacillus bifermentans DSM 20003]QGG60356.1 transporter [Loigolactobacillus bifermentans]
MFGYLLFVITMSFTPGPNTIMAMSEGQQKGFRRSLTFNWGILLGMVIVGGIIGLFANYFQQNQLVIVAIKVIGAGYLLYLAYHILRSAPDSAAQATTHPFITGTFLQTMNVKVYLYFITGLSTFSIAGLWGEIPVKFGLMLLLGVLGTMTWTLAGQLLQQVYQRHYRSINTVIALLLCFSAYDIWR